MQLGPADLHPGREPAGVRAEPLWTEPAQPGRDRRRPVPTEVGEYVSSFLDRVDGSNGDISESLRLESSAVRTETSKWGGSQQEMGSSHQLNVVIQGC